jgi:hypothetical protein
MDLSIIIVNWNTGKLLSQCLNSIFNSETKHSYEVFVVDNASTDKSIQLDSKNYPKVNFIVNSHNIGFAAANNQAIKKAKGEFILLLNPDTIVQKDNIEKTLSYLMNDKNNGDVGILGCSLYHPSGELQRSIQTFPTIIKGFLVAAGLNIISHRSALGKAIAKRIFKYFPKNLGTINWQRYKKNCNVDSVLGAYFLIRKSVVYNIGMLDENFFMFGEEMEFALRAKKVGWNTRFYANAAIIHYGNRSIKKISNEMYLELARSLIYFCQKHRSKIYLAIYKLAWLTGFIINIYIRPRLIFSSVELPIYSKSNFCRMFFKILLKPIIKKTPGENIKI